MSKKRKAPTRAVKKDPYSLEELLTSSDSKLIDIDLHGNLASFFSDPRNWAAVPESDKNFIRSLLPPHVELNDDGSIPTAFWKYNPEFRLDCRNLQEDLRSGRMDPEWQRQAAQAMEERAAGEFDDFKEREFEEYWGQKQKVDWNVLAGHASKVKLDEMLREGMFKVGDAWSFDHTWGRGADAVRVEKECKIVKMSRKSVTLAIPPGQLKFARRLAQGNPGEKEPAMGAATVPEPGISAGEEGKIGDAITASGEPEAKKESTSVSNRDHMTPAGLDVAQGTESEAQETTIQQPQLKETERDSPEDSKDVDSKTHSPKSSKGKLRSRPFKCYTNTSSPTPSSKVQDSPTASTNENHDLIAAATAYDVVLYEITGLYALERKILEIDGRAKPGSRTGSTWRDIRCRRDEQDMGSLFEMRDEYYAYKVAEGSYRRPEMRSK
ncbi:MAG: hypothetical protein Q9188_003263 [Gyalolechia gomerana]